MTEMGHDPNFFLGNDRDPVVTPNTTYFRENTVIKLTFNLNYIKDKK